MISSLSVIIPCHNEEDSIVQVLRDLDRALKSLPLTSEIIVVDDGSTDRTVERIQQTGLAPQVLRHRMNRGYGASLKTGIRQAKHEYVLMMDADGQHSADSIPTLLAEMEECDMVIGARSAWDTPGWRIAGKIILKKISEILVGTKIPDINSGFRVIRKSEVLRYMHLCSDQFSFSTSITLAFLSERLAVRFVPISVQARTTGQSRVNVKTGLATFMLILRIISTFNPLKVFLPPALLSFGAGVILFAFGLYHRNVSEMAVILLVAGLLLFCFGLLADQLAFLRREMSQSR